MSVKAGQRHDSLLGHDVEDAVGKSTEERRSNIGVDNRERKRIARQGVADLRPGPCCLRVPQMISETTVRFLALSLSHGERFGMLSDAIPHGLNMLNTGDVPLSVESRR